MTRKTSGLDRPPGHEQNDVPNRIELPDGRNLLKYDSVDSTQDVARDLVKAGETHCAGIISNFQKCGRGRSGRDWFAPAGDNLLATYILEQSGEAMSSGNLALAAGVAVAEAISSLSGIGTGLKWPNDVMTGKKKIAGVLIEIVRNAEYQWIALVGIGVNVNVARLPSELAQCTTSMRLETSQSFEVADVEVAVRESLSSYYETLQNRGLRAIIQMWRSLDNSTGLPFASIINGRKVSGKARGIADNGALILELESGEIIEDFNASAAKQ